MARPIRSVHINGQAVRALFDFDFQADPVPRIGQDEAGKEIDILIGATAMEQ